MAGYRHTFREHEKPIKVPAWTIVVGATIFGILICLSVLAQATPIMRYYAYL